MPEGESERVVRATFRCLREDLVPEVGPDVLRSALGTVANVMAVDPPYVLPCALVDAEHVVLDKANQIAIDGAAHREQIKTLADRRVLKVKTGDRRAALWQDDDGTWWLLAAGRRKNDTAGDFYREIKRFAADTTPIAPTQEDLSYQRFEAAYADECAVERAAHAAVLGAVLDAARHLRSVAQIEVFGATVTIAIVPDEDGLAVLEMGWEFAEFDQQDRFPMDVLAMVPGREDIDAWDYQPPREDAASPHTWFTYVPSAWIENLATSVELDELLDVVKDWKPVNPTSNGTEHFSHYARESVVTLAYVTGIEIVALCGASVVAHRDYEQFPVCPTCEENLRLLRSLKGLRGS